MQLLTFSLNGVKYGIPIEDVQSIEQRINITNIPTPLPYIRGIMRLHGNVIPVYSLAGKFGYPEQKIDNIVVTDVNGMPVGFEVCRVEEILEVEGEDIISMPRIISQSMQYMPDVANHNKDLIVLLNVGELLSEEEQRSLQKLLEEKQEETAE